MAINYLMIFITVIGLGLVFTSDKINNIILGIVLLIIVFIFTYFGAVSAESKESKETEDAEEDRISVILESVSEILGGNDIEVFKDDGDVVFIKSKNNLYEVGLNDSKEIKYVLLGNKFIYYSYDDRTEETIMKNKIDVYYNNMSDEELKDKLKQAGFEILEDKPGVLIVEDNN